MQFTCRVGTPEGEVVEQSRDGADETAVRRDLERLGYHLFEIRPKSTVSRLFALRGTKRRKRIDMRALLIFNQELAALLRSGLPILQALELMVDRQRDPQFRELLLEVREKVKGGEDLSTAFGAHRDLLPPLYPPSLQAGERSGELEQVIRRFVRYQQLVLETRKRVVSALVYPVTLIALSVALIAVMMVYVLPKFTVFFNALNVELPLVTRVTMGLATFVKANVWLLVGGLVTLVFLYRRFTNTLAGRNFMARVRLKIPLIGSIFHRMALSEFCRSMATLLAGGIPIVASMETSVQAVGNLYIRRRLEPAIKGVREGQSLADTLAESGVTEDIIVDMVKVGETTGSLDVMLSDVSSFMDEEVETKLQRLLTLLEPIMMALMGIIVATLLVSVYLPIFSLLGQVQS